MALCPKQKDCSNCHLYTMMYAPNPDDPTKPKEEWDCTFNWIKILLSETQARISVITQAVTEASDGKQKETDNNQT